MVAKFYGVKLDIVERQFVVPATSGGREVDIPHRLLKAYESCAFRFMDIQRQLLALYEEAERSEP